MIQYKKDLYRSAALGSEIIAAICGPTPKRGNHGAWLLIHNSGEKFYRWFWWIHCSQVSQEFSEFLRDREGDLRFKDVQGLAYLESLSRL